jgi:hypothetical protein
MIARLFLRDPDRTEIDKLAVPSVPTIQETEQNSEKAMAAASRLFAGYKSSEIRRLGISPWSAAANAKRVCDIVAIIGVCI